MTSAQDEASSPMNESESAIRSAIANLLTSQLRSVLATVREGQISSTLMRISGAPLGAVRSSTIDKDQVTGSFSGLHEPILGLPPPSSFPMLKKCGRPYGRTRHCFTVRSAGSKPSLIQGVVILY